MEKVSRQNNPEANSTFSPQIIAYLVCGHLLSCGLERYQMTQNLFSK